jgi:hypothetical protein
MAKALSTMKFRNFVKQIKVNGFLWKASPILTKRAKAMITTIIRCKPSFGRPLKWGEMILVLVGVGKSTRSVAGRPSSH